jgi:hypothetical protein
LVAWKNLIKILADRRRYNQGSPCPSGRLTQIKKPIFIALPASRRWRSHWYAVIAEP